MSARKTTPAKRLPVVADSFDASALLSESVALLALIAPPVLPSPRVKKLLLTRIRASQPTSPAGWRISPVATDAGWVPLPFPGVRMREVTIDADRDTALLYVEIEPGGIFPDHDHSATERGLLLTGDLRTAGRMLAPGDFYEADAGTKHDRIVSPSGCTGLLWVGAEAWRKWRGEMAAALAGT